VAPPTEPARVGDVRARQRLVFTLRDTATKTDVTLASRHDVVVVVDSIAKTN
jgi:hypothetical protein